MDARSRGIRRERKDGKEETSGQMETRRRARENGAEGGGGIPLLANGEKEKKEEKGEGRERERKRKNCRGK